MDTIKEQFIQLRAEGNSFNSIAKKLKKAKGTLIVWNKELEEEIGNCKALHLETLYEKYFLLRENRLQLFGNVLLKLQKELSERDFATVPTDKLLELLPKYHALLKDEFIELKFSTEQEMQDNKQEKQELDSIISLIKANT